MSFESIFGFQNKDKAGVNPIAGSEKKALGALFQGGYGVLNGLFNDSDKEATDAQDQAYKNAGLMQQYQNNLPAMFAARKKARQQASGLASLAGLY